MANPSEYNYTTDSFHLQAMNWLDQQKGSNQPFFLYMSYTVPHAGGWGDSPQDPENGNPVPSDGEYAKKPWPNVEKDHAASVTHMDTLIGELLAKIQNMGIQKDTLIFFVSDNGAHNEGGHKHVFFNSTGGLRGFKRSFYEGGIRSPSLALWPGKIAPNVVSKVSWAFWDVLATFSDILGVKVPESAIDGRSFLPTLLGKPQDPPEYQYWTWTGTQQSAKTVGYSTRVQKWKGVVHSCSASNSKPSLGDSMELYDLENDLFEKENIANKHPDIVKEIKTLLVKKDLSCACYQC